MTEKQKPFAEAPDPKLIPDMLDTRDIALIVRAQLKAEARRPGLKDDQDSLDEDSKTSLSPTIYNQESPGEYIPFAPDVPDIQKGAKIYQFPKRRNHEEVDETTQDGGA